MAARDWKILVVEDDADGQEVMATLLRHLNIDIDIAGDAAEAERLLFTTGNVYTVYCRDRLSHIQAPRGCYRGRV
jgi:CheY-like chemotaxis protein